VPKQRWEFNVFYIGTNSFDPKHPTFLCEFQDTIEREAAVMNEPRTLHSRWPKKRYRKRLFCALVYLKSN